MSRRLVVSLVFVLGLVPGGAVAARPCWLPPVAAAVTDPFREPDCRWCPGNRGIEFGTSPGASVRAVATGRVTYSGRIAGTGYVVVRHADGLRTTYGNVDGRRYSAGDPVVRGSLLGFAGGRVHFGLRDGARYLDPAPYLGRLVHRPRLVPVDGSRGAPAPPPRLRCGR